ncbi:MAG: 3'-5' exonuclease [Oligoflexia bacterium]|nr:3'-5' exonuclease [Oligoflexia bacterium]MBF0365325.1 3'-5' exonuclease [Oligoflexia bacterium]
MGKGQKQNSLDHTTSSAASESNLKLHLPENEIRAILNFFPRGVVAFDLETTGFSPMTDKIIEIGALKITADGAISPWQSLVNPRVIIPNNTIDIHHITNEMVASSPTISEILPAFIRFTGDLPIVAHNAKFDLGFILFSLRELDMNAPDCEIFDSCRLARKAGLKSANNKLATLAEHFAIPLAQHHRAFYDAFVCMRVFAKCLDSMSNTTNFSTILDIARIYRLSPRLIDKINMDIPLGLRPLIPRLASQELVEIRYDGGSHKGNFRPIKPVALIPLPSGPVLYALCIHSLTNKSFALRKILEVKLLSSEEIDKWQKYLEEKVQAQNQTNKSTTPLDKSDINLEEN